jgi:lipooligosaccharide transport system permease protein
MYLVAFGYGLTPLVGDVPYRGQTVSYLEFIAPGMIAIGVLFQSFFEGAFGSFIRLSFQRTWHALLTAPLTFTEVFLGDWLWAATKGSIAGLLTGIVAVIWGLYSGWHLLVSLPLIILGSLLFGVMGLFVAGTVRTVDQINIPIFLFVIPMFTFCGTYFPRDTLPPLLNSIASLLPLASIVDLLRWPLGLWDFWFLQLIWLLLWASVFSVLAWRQIYPHLLR